MDGTSPSGFVNSTFCGMNCSSNLSPTPNPNPNPSPNPSPNPANTIIDY